MVERPAGCARPSFFVPPRSSRWYQPCGPFDSTGSSLIPLLSVAIELCSGTSATLSSRCPTDATILGQRTPAAMQTMQQTTGTIPDATRLPGDHGEGGRAVLDRQLPLLYDQLKRIAARQLRRERAGHTLSPSALVHEAYLKLAVQTRVELKNRSHLLALSARMMRRVLVDHARGRDAHKRGGDWIQTTLPDEASPTGADPDDLLALDSALQRLDARQRKVVELRFFVGMTEAEIGEVLDLSTRTVRRDWGKARAWLYSELHPVN
jgi:RNA polymerase sigma-70 factor, ECF subfamily